MATTLVLSFHLRLLETGSIDATQVVQYILDLNDNRFSDGVIRQFTGNVCALSVQKFSSNVIEKVYRTELNPIYQPPSHACLSVFAWPSMELVNF